MSQADLGTLARRMRNAAAELADAKAEAMAFEVTGHSGNGLVSATLTGNGRLVALRVDPSVIDPGDPEAISELIIAAVDEAFQDLTARSERSFGAFTEGFGEILHDVRRRTEQLRSAPRPIQPVRAVDGRVFRD